MGHRCYQCGCKCHCCGDIDDIILDEVDYCEHCRGDSDWDEDDYYFCHDCNKPESVCECK